MKYKKQLCCLVSNDMRVGCRHREHRICYKHWSLLCHTHRSKMYPKWNVWGEYVAENCDQCFHQYIKEKGAPDLDAPASVQEHLDRPI